MGFNIFIPARFDSSRLPGKPLERAGGRPLIEWVWNAARRSDADRIVIATDDERVAAAAEAFGAEVCLTGRHHASGTDRISEAAGCLGLDPASIVVNLQGDEPGMPGELINGVARTLAESSEASIATAASPMADEADMENPNIVKVVCNRNGDGLYFSRSRIPYPREAGAGAVAYRHLGIYAYRCDYLRQFTARAPTVLERTECLEQLRALEYGDRIAVYITASAPSPGIDTPEDLERFRREVEHD
jgi:3-deoxy-manno-octulosonate cytidylyltransferase (CMP-KDO synthetase)